MNLPWNSCIFGWNCVSFWRVRFQNFAHPGSQRSDEIFDPDFFFTLSPTSHFYYKKGFSSIGMLRKIWHPYKHVTVGSPPSAIFSQKPASYHNQSFNLGHVSRRAIHIKPCSDEFRRRQLLQLPWDPYLGTQSALFTCKSLRLSSKWGIFGSVEFNKLESLIFSKWLVEKIRGN